MDHDLDHRPIPKPIEETYHCHRIETPAKDVSFFKQPLRSRTTLPRIGDEVRVDQPALPVVPVDPNTIRFRMLKDNTRIQLDLHAALRVDRILLGAIELRYERDSGAVFVDFPETLHAGRVYSIDFYYSGNPVETGRFGAIGFRKDPSGHPWINTAC